MGNETVFARRESVEHHHGPTLEVSPSSPEASRAGGNAALLEPISVRIPDAVRLTGIGRSKIYEAIKARQLEVSKSGSSTLIIFESLRQLVYKGRR